MLIHFGEKFKTLRKDSDLTQEQVAEIFNVSPQSVSRWEKGINYPDIEILPHIAIFFKVSVDELLGTDIVRGERKSAEYIRDIRNLLNSGRPTEAVDKAYDAVKEYPMNYQLQGHFLQALCTLYQSKSSEIKEATDKLKKEIVTVGERIINHSTDTNNVLWAKWQLFHQYIKWGEVENAKKIVYTLPSEAYYTQDLCLGFVLEGDAWLKNQRLRIVRFTIMLCDLIKMYAHKAELDVLQKIECAKSVMQIEKLTQQIHGEEEDVINIAFQNIVLAELYCEAGDAENALDCIKKSTEIAVGKANTMNITNDDGSNYFAWETDRNLCRILCDDFLTKPKFDVVRNDNKFIKCFELLKIIQIS